MEKRIKILVNDLEVEAELNESETGLKVWKSLPIEGKTNLWGEEIYFAIPTKVGLEKGAREVLSAGELGYWPAGNAFCIFFGPTPASQGNEIRAASAVNVIGKVLSDPKVFRRVRDGAKITLKRA